MPKSKPKARKAAAPAPGPAPAPAKQPSSGARHPVLSFRVTPECVMLLDEMTAYYQVSRREIIDRALREFYRGEFSQRRGKMKANAK